MPTLTSGQLGRRLNVADGTIRNWSSQFGDFLSESARGRRPGATRRYTEEDAIILATVAHLRDQGLALEQIEQALTQGTRVEVVPAPPTPEEEEARASVGLVPVAELYRAMDRIRTLEEEITRVLSERDQERVKADEANDRIAAMREELGGLRAQVRIQLVALVVGGLMLAAVVGLAVALFLR